MIRDWLPRALTTPLFGDREKFGAVPNPADPDWIEWQCRYSDFYMSTQKQGIGARVNEAGYRILDAVEVDGLTVAEIGPGGMFHLDRWHGSPSKFIAIDVDPSFLDTTSAKLAERGVACEARLMERDQLVRLPAADGEADIVLSFYSLEHLHPLRDYVAEIKRMLKPGGLLVGAIPAEGGLPWGLGRFLTSRRWFLANTTIDPDKIICWEHPNFADAILQELETTFIGKRLDFWPLGIPLIDANLVIRMIYQKQEH